MFFPNILVISNQCFSKSTSNGRSLGSLFLGWPKERLAQFCLDLQDPDIDLCDKYFCITDKEALNAILHKNMDKADANVGGVVQKSNRPSHQKFPLLMLLREVVWRTNCWKKNGFEKWVDSYNPEVVLLQSGDSAFMLHIAQKVAKKKNIPLLIYNTEGYYFLSKPWTTKHWSNVLFFPILKRLYRKEYKKLMTYASGSVYLNDALREDYDKEFATLSEVIYTSSSMSFKPKKFNGASPHFCYLGNLGLGRYKALIEIADTLQSINPSYHLDVYGRLNPGIEHVFDGIPSIVFHGMIPYNEVQKVINDSDLLFHAEVDDKRWQESLKYGFSTKIADSISSGHNFLLYAPRHISSSKYIIENGAAWYVENKSQLKSTLQTILSDSDARETVLKRARVVAKNNHNEKRNAEKFQNWLMDNCK